MDLHAVSTIDDPLCGYVVFKRNGGDGHYCGKPAKFWNLTWHEQHCAEHNRVRSKQGNPGIPLHPKGTRVGVNPVRAGGVP